MDFTDAMRIIDLESKHIIAWLIICNSFLRAIVHVLKSENSNERIDRWYSQALQVQKEAENHSEVAQCRIHGRSDVVKDSSLPIPAHECVSQFMWESHSYVRA
jgi:hypothetical protein